MNDTWDTYMTSSTILPTNLHPWERIGRMVLGIAMFVIGWLVEASPWGGALRIFAFYPVVTAAAGWCPLYALLRFHTNR